VAPRVAYWNNIPAPYVVDRFNAVAPRGNIELEAWFSYRSEPDRSWTVDEREWQFAYRWLPSPGGFALPAPLLGRTPPELLVSLYGWPWFAAGFVLAKARRRTRVAFECEVTSERWVRRRAWKEAVKRSLFPRLDAVLTVGEDGERYARGYGAAPARMLRVPHSIGAIHFSPEAEAARGRREDLRAELGLLGTVFLYVGRLWWGKGLDTLLDAYRDLRGEGAEAALVLAGDGPDAERLRRRTQVERIPDVVLAGFREGLELVALYGAADAFVFPTLGDPYGLVVEEAMAAGLPVVSSSAAGEIRSRVREGESGYVVSPEDGRALRERMARLLDPGVRRRLGETARASVADRTPETWAARFEEAVSQALSFPRR
jgi:glycosyltransferase involved in cell wall biosynthesis